MHNVAPPLLSTAFQEREKKYQIYHLPFKVKKKKEKKNLLALFL